MFLCVDQEGGLVNRVSFGTTCSGNMALAAAGDLSLAEESAKIMGDEISSLGFNMDFAPVSDVNSNPANPIIGVRSFSDDPAITSDFVRAFIKGLRAAGVSSALKHFPGHGNVGEASHFDPTDAAVLAINAVVDILLCPVDLYKDDETDTFGQMETYMANLVKRVEAGDVSEEEIDDSVFRILKLKKEKNIYKDMVLPSGTLPVNVPTITVNGDEIVFEEEYLYNRGFGLSDWGK